MEFKQLLSFVTVVRNQSFTKAAEELYTSQPTISAHIRQLEEEVHFRLIIRTTKSIEITPRGRELYDFASHVLSLKDDLLRHWTMEQQAIRLGTSTIPSTYILPELLPAYRDHYPDFQFNISQGDSRHMLDALLHGSLDVALIGMNSSEEGIVFIPFYEDSMVLITPVTERFIQYKKHSPDVKRILQTESLLLRETTSGSQKYIDTYLRQLQLADTDLNIIARLNDQESIKQLVSSGLGISIISSKAAQNFETEQKLLCFPLPDQTQKRILYIAYRRDFILSEQTMQFISFTTSFYKA